ncbi:MAG: hypothetical protein M3P99_08085 [Pseudomonadota bacterium]|nr:hypothetical protein [Pseudomonadota bacterium]
MTVEFDASPWIDALGGLSRWYMRKMPPYFCANTVCGINAANTSATAAATSL